MTHRFNKRRFWVAVAALAIAEFAVIFLALRWKYIFPTGEVSSLYTRYADVEGMEVTYVKDYKVNDTVLVDVTLIEATDPVVWDGLCEDFDIVPISMYPPEYKAMMSAGHSFDYKVFNDTVITGPDSVIANDLIVFSHLEMTMCIFHNASEIQLDAIIDNYYEEITF